MGVILFQQVPVQGEFGKKMSDFFDSDGGYSSFDDLSFLEEEEEEEEDTNLVVYLRENPESFFVVTEDWVSEQKVVEELSKKVDKLKQKNQESKEYIERDIRERKRKAKEDRCPVSVEDIRHRVYNRGQTDHVKSGREMFLRLAELDEHQSACKSTLLKYMN